MKMTNVKMSILCIGAILSYACLPCSSAEAYSLSYDTRASLSNFSESGVSDIQWLKESRSQSWSYLRDIASGAYSHLYNPTDGSGLVSGWVGPLSTSSTQGDAQKQATGTGDIDGSGLRVSAKGSTDVFYDVESWGYAQLYGEFRPSQEGIFKFSADYDLFGQNENTGPGGWTWTNAEVRFTILRPDGSVVKEEERRISESVYGETDFYDSLCPFGKPAMTP